MEINLDLFIQTEAGTAVMGCLAIMDASDSIRCVATATIHRDAPPPEKSVNDALTPGDSF